MAIKKISQSFQWDLVLKYVGFIHLHHQITNHSFVERLTIKNNLCKKAKKQKYSIEIFHVSHFYFYFYFHLFNWHNRVHQ